MRDAGAGSRAISCMASGERQQTNDPSGAPFFIEFKTARAGTGDFLCKEMRESREREWQKEKKIGSVARARPPMQLGEAN